MIRVERGWPTDEEPAAVVAVLLVRASAHRPTRRHWLETARAQSRLPVPG
jgi:acyl-CoA carboxylase epsilon subunit-like protein